MVNNLKNEYVILANKLADVAADIAKQYFRSKDSQELVKDDLSPVTIADTEIEKEIRNIISQKFPEHGIVGEELDNIEGNSPYKWFIDPIDGTSSFIQGKPLFTTIIGLSYEDKPIYGLINQPISNERWQGGIAYQAKFNGENIQSRKKDELDDAVFVTTSQYLFSNDEQVKIDSLRAKTKYQKYGGVFLGGDAYNYALLASGFIDIIVESGLKTYDFMGLAPIIRSAGGEITDWDGNELDANSDGRVIATGSKKLHKEVLEILKG